MSILGRLTPVNRYEKDDVSSIFLTEDKVFYEKYKDIHSPSKSPVLNHQDSFKSKKFKSPSSSKKNYRTLPTIKGNKDFIKNLHSRRKLELKLDDLVSTANEIHRQSIEESTRLSFFISKERLVARNYWENVKRTSEKVSEMSEYLGKFPITIFRDQQSKEEEALEEQKQIIKRYNYKSLDHYKKKAKGIKRFLVNFKNKIIP